MIGPDRFKGFAKEVRNYIVFMIEVLEFEWVPKMGGAGLPVSRKLKWTWLVLT